MKKKSTLYWKMLPCGLTLATWMDVSTRHITKQDSQLLGIDCDASSPAAVVFRKENQGHVVHVPHDDVEENERELREAGYSPEFVRILQIACAEGASWVFLHSDGSETEVLPTFDW